MTKLKDEPSAQMSSLLEHPALAGLPMAFATQPEHLGSSFLSAIESVRLFFVLK